MRTKLIWRTVCGMLICIAVVGCTSREQWCAQAADVAARLEQCQKDNTCRQYIGGAAGLAGAAARAKVQCEWRDKPE